MPMQSMQLLHATSICTTHCSNLAHTSNRHKSEEEIKSMEGTINEKNEGMVCGVCYDKNCKIQGGLHNWVSSLMHSCGLDSGGTLGTTIVQNS